MLSEEQLQATGLPENVLETYRLAKTLDLPKPKRDKLAKKLKVASSTVKRHLAQIRLKVSDPKALDPPTPGARRTLERAEPEKFADAVVSLSQPGAKISRVAKEVGIEPNTAKRIAARLDGDLQLLKREVEDVAIEDITKRFGTLTRDALDHITTDKLKAATAQQLAVIAGIAGDKFQLFRGAPTSRTEINDRREMNELVKLVIQEAKRRDIEIDITPEGGVVAQPSPYRSIREKRMRKQINSGDPPEARTP